MRSPVLLPTLLAIGALACSGDPVGPPVGAQQASEAVDRWVRAHPNEWVVEVTGFRAPRLVEWSQPCTQSPPSGRTVLEVAQGDTRLHLFFNCPLAADPGPADLRSAFAYAVVETLPHGIWASGWEFRVLTPTSSITSGVSFATASAGRLRITLQTGLFAVHGRNILPRCEGPQDSSAPTGCTVQRAHDIALDLEMTVPYVASAIR